MKTNFRFAILDLRLNYGARCSAVPKQKSKIKNRKCEAGFTMVEIAISLAVMAFALVAIIGVLPMGLNVQRENREDTLVNQDGQFILETVRNAQQGMNYLTQHVEFITIEKITAAGTNTTRYYDSIMFPNVPLIPLPSGTTVDFIRTSREIVGLLTTPKYEPSGASTITNRVTARIHSLTGAAAEQGTDPNDSARELSFAYQLTSEVMPFAFFSPVTFAPGDSPAEGLVKSNRTREITMLSGVGFQNITNTNANIFEIRQAMRWPVRPDGKPTPQTRRQQFRGIVSSILRKEQTNGVDLWFFDPQRFQRPAQP